MPSGLVTTGLSILVALTIWIVAIESRTFRVETRLPVLPPDLPDSLVISGPLDPESVTVIFSGSGAAILAGQISGCPVAVGARMDSLPRREYPLTSAMTITPDLMAWRGRPFSPPAEAAFDPPTIVCTIDRIGTDTLPVKVMAAGGVPARYFWAVSEPGSVEVTGPAGAIALADSARTLEVLPGQPLQTVSLAPCDAFSGSIPGEVGAALTPPPPLLEFTDL
ncbi:hypothetical protein GX411_11025 [Candidatus Fermentibacteria bacterium]|nr:hypothetical protein [Candidatus Fermentibacteria bacterium]